MHLYTNIYKRAQSHLLLFALSSCVRCDYLQLLLCGVLSLSLNSIVCWAHHQMMMMMMMLVTINLILNIGRYGLNRIKQYSGWRMLCELCKLDSNAHGPNHHRHRIYSYVCLLYLLLLWFWRVSHRAFAAASYGNMLIVIRKLFTFHLKCQSAVMSSVTYKMRTVRI